MKKPSQYLSVLVALSGIFCGAFSIDYAKADTISLWQPQRESFSNLQAVAVGNPLFNVQPFDFSASSTSNISIVVFRPKMLVAGCYRLSFFQSASEREFAFALYNGVDPLFSFFATSTGFFIPADNSYSGLVLRQVDSSSYPTSNSVCGVTHVVSNVATSSFYGTVNVDAGSLSAPPLKTLFYAIYTGNAYNTITATGDKYTAPGVFDAFATSSVDSYCVSTFSTSTTIVESLVASISTGFCRTGVFLFIPNQSILTQFYDMSGQVKDHAPFTYFFDLQNAFNGLTASSSTNLPTYSANLGSLGIGSTTPLGNILPNLTILSSSTVNTYVPAGFYASLMFLARASIWLGVGFTLYAIGKKELKPKHA